MNRRSFLRMLGLAPAAAAIPALADERETEWVFVGNGSLPATYELQPDDFLPFDYGPVSWRRVFVRVEAREPHVGFWNDTFD